MKKLFFAFIILGISLKAFAQNEGNSENQGDLESQFYFRFGYSLPVSNYLMPVDSDTDLDWTDISRFGTSFELGSIFMLNGIPMPDGLRLGVNIDYLSTSFHRLTVAATDTIYEEIPGGEIKVWKLAAKLGLSLSYSPVQDLVFDMYFKAHVPALTTKYFDSFSFENIGTRAIGYATGINVRYTFLLLGVEYNTVNMIFEDTDKVALPNINFIIGFSF